jgi:diacylglycerol kinase (ATP)
MPNVCVIYNPQAGRGRAAARLKRVQSRLAGRAEFRPTDGPGHAVELAQQAARDGFSVVAAAGGDGTIHEVANGLLRADRPDTALGILPVGSANDYAHTLGLSTDWSEREPFSGGCRSVDVGVVSSPGGRRRYFVNGLGVGFNGAVTFESRRVRGLQGVPLYAVALVRAVLFHFRTPELTLQLDDLKVQQPTLALTVALGRREGNFVLTPHAKLDDGLFDYLIAGQLARWELLRYFPAMVSGRIPTDDPKVRSGTCRRVGIAGDTPLMAHVDGEFFCLPTDDVKELTVELLPAALRVCV